MDTKDNSRKCSCGVSDQDPIIQDLYNQIAELKAKFWLWERPNTPLTDAVSKKNL